MTLSTNKTATFESWFTTLQQVALHDYSLPISTEENHEYRQFYKDGLNQNEVLSA